MKFETYEIDGDNITAKEAAVLNGLIEIVFYREIFYYDYDDSWTNPWTTNPWTTDPWTTNPWTTTHYLSNENKIYSTIKTNILFNEDLFTNKIETGRVEIGEESNQDMNHINVKFEETAFHTITYQLKPNSIKPIEFDQIRNYCNRCGYRLRKKSWKFCPKCGLSI